MNDDEIGTVVSEELNPAKARVLLELVLAQTTDVAAVQNAFDRD